MRLDEIRLVEGIEDKGIFKAVFMSGMPGSGKTTVAKAVTDGTVSPRNVNTDDAFEFLSAKQGMEADSVAWSLVGQRSKKITEERLYHYINSMVPLFIDGTSGNIGAMVRRQGLLEGLGYDTMMVWVDVTLETALERAAQRDRKVDEDYIRKIYAQIESSKQYYQHKFGNNFIVVDNNGDNLQKFVKTMYNRVNAFFTSPVSNPNGQNNLNKLKQAKEKYLVPTIVNEQFMKDLVKVWYLK